MSGETSPSGGRVAVSRDSVQETAATRIGREGPSGNGPVPLARQSAPPALGLGLGQPLPARERSYFERRLRTDLSDVRVHPDADAAGKLGALAFTAGHDIGFAPGQFRPGSTGFSDLLGHELGHVVQQGTSGPAIQLQPTGAPDTANADAKAEKDAQLQTRLHGLPPLFFLTMVPEIGGLQTWKSDYPVSYADQRPGVVGVIGEAAMQNLERNDAEILGYVRKSAQIIAGLNQLKFRDDAQAAKDVVGFYTGYIGQAGFYEFDYTFFALMYRDNPKAKLEPIGWLLGGDVDKIIASVRESADLAQGEADALAAQRAAWRADGETVLGQQIATKQRTLWFDDSVNLESLLTPEWGSESADEMLTVARASGATTAVVKVKERYYVYLLNEQYDRSDLFLLPDKDVYVEMLPAGPIAGSVLYMTANGGFVLRPPGQGQDLFRAGDESENALKRLESDTALQTSGKAAEYGLSPMQMFQRMLMDLALHNLRVAEERLKGIERDVTDEGIFNRSPSAEKGNRLAKDTKRLHQLTVDLNALASAVDGKEATDAQTDQRDAWLMEMSRIVEANPGAALFVRNNADPDDKKPAAEDDIENRLGSKTGLDAANEASKQANERLENIATVRRAIFDEPERVLDFDILHESVLTYFSPDDRRSISIGLAFHTLDKFAHGVRVGLVDLGLLLGGLATGGETWVGLAVHGAGLGFGGYQLYQQAQDSAVISAQSELDVEGGFQLSTRDQAKSSQRWLAISAGLNLLAAFGFVRSVGVLLEASSREATLAARVATRLGVSEDVLRSALRKSWRGVPDPHPDALRKILLARMDPQLASRYQGIKINVLSDSDWLKAFPNSAAHAETRFITNAAGETIASEVNFRSGGSLLSLEEEAAHIAQAADPRWGAKLVGTQSLAKEWGTLSEIAKLQGMRDVLEVELDVQQRLMKQAKSIGDTEAMDDAFEHMSDIKDRIGDIDAKFADPNSRKYLSWFDPARPPGIFNTPRLPRTSGSWSGAPGNSIWTSDKQDVIDIIGPSGGVRFRNGYPDFAPWSKGRVNLGTMSGESDDFAEANRLFAESVMNRGREPPPGFTRDQFIYRGEPNASTTSLYLKQAGLTWHHHQGGKLMLLVPTKLHANVPHTGGASAARAAG